jgi:hypothetical protein
MQTDKEFNLELSSIARLLCLQPNKRRAVKLDLPMPIYRIEDRASDELLSLIAFQPITKPITEIRQAPIKKGLAKECAKHSAQEQKPWWILLNWTDSHFGLLKGADYFELDDWPHAPGNPEILLPDPKNMILLYHYNGKDQTKLMPSDIFK